MHVQADRGRCKESAGPWLLVLVEVGARVQWSKVN